MSGNLSVSKWILIFYELDIGKQRMRHSVVRQAPTHRFGHPGKKTELLHLGP